MNVCQQHHSSRTFAHEQPAPALLNAVLAISAKHLSLRGQLDESVSLHYIDACYRALLPDISTKAFHGDHLAAVLILRLVVQMTDPREAEQGGNVFLGIDVFMVRTSSKRHFRFC